MNFKEEYEKNIKKELMKELDIKNKLSAPKPQKVVVNIGLGRTSKAQNFKDKILPEITKELSDILGQKPSISAAKKSIAGFKTRKGDIVGIKATLRGNRMFDFIEKLIKVVFPRLRDFKGIDLKNVDSSPVPLLIVEGETATIARTIAVTGKLYDKSGILLEPDSSGNFNLGLKEQVVFPEINQDASNMDFGMQITIVPNTKNRDEAIMMYRKMGFLFKENKKNNK